jgi:hypothetical protein
MRLRDRGGRTETKQELESWGGQDLHQVWMRSWLCCEIPEGAGWATSSSLSTHSWVSNRGHAVLWQLRLPSVKIWKSRLVLNVTGLLASCALYLDGPAWFCWDVIKVHGAGICIRTRTV